MYNFKDAFTLTEILITLGIIAIVSALTIPGLINNYKAKRLRSQFLKSYSSVQQAFKLMEVDDVSTDISTYAGKMGSFYNTFSQYFKGAHLCGYYEKTSKVAPCLDYKNHNYKSLDGKYNLTFDYFTDGQFVLPDGTLIMIDNPNWGDFVWIFVDLNGYYSPPNRLGYDLFTFEIKNGELRVMGDNETRYTDIDEYCNTKKSNSSNGIACAYKAKNNSDYFKWAVKNVK